MDTSQEPLPSGPSGLLTAERIALTVARRHVAAGDAVPAGIAALLAGAVGRLTGTPDDEAAAVVTEHGVEYPSGDMVVRWSSPTLEALVPLATWLEIMQEQGTVVKSRQIIVVSDWTDVPAAPAAADA